jgi:hypothetical protein
VPLIKCSVSMEFLAEVPESDWMDRWGEGGDSLTRDLAVDAMLRVLSCGGEPMTKRGALGERAGEWSDERFSFSSWELRERRDE